MNDGDGGAALRMDDGALTPPVRTDERCVTMGNNR
jgi:hypothetical protein